MTALVLSPTAVKTKMKHPFRRLVSCVVGRSVRKAALALDIEAPGWETRVDTDRLDLMDGQACICFYVFGQFGYTRYAESLSSRYRFTSYVFAGNGFRWLWKNEIVLREV